MILFKTNSPLGLGRAGVDVVRFMADYYSLLSRAVSNLPKSSPASARRAIYDRARKALIGQLRSLKPPLPESDIAREENALDAAIAQIELGSDRKEQLPPPLRRPRRRERLARRRRATAPRSRLRRSRPRQARRPNPPLPSASRPPRRKARRGRR